MGFVSGNHVLLFIVFLVIVFVVFGPGKLPDAGAGLGKAIREFRKASAEVKDAIAPGGHVAPATTIDPAPPQAHTRQTDSDVPSPGSGTVAASAGRGA